MCLVSMSLFIEYDAYPLCRRHMSACFCRHHPCDVIACPRGNYRFAFLALVTVGVGILFFCTPAINMGFMLAVPTGVGLFVVEGLKYAYSFILFAPHTANQSFGLAMMVVFMHALGDVPSPVIVGLIKVQYQQSVRGCTCVSLNLQQVDMCGQRCFVFVL